MSMDGSDVIPEPPVFTEEELNKCRDSGEYRPVLFEWYKYVGLLCGTFAHFQPDSPALKQVRPLHFAVLTGLLYRCARLMISNLALSEEGLFGETTAIVDRCIFESSVKASWLCRKGSDEAFERFFSDGLKTELELKKEIHKKIDLRGGAVVEIEERMLLSIDDYIASSGMSEEQIRTARKLPNLAAMIEDLGYDRIAYVVWQRIGSHHIHGTWPSLKTHYLKEDEKGHFRPRGHRNPTHENQYVYVPLLVLNTLNEFVNFTFAHSEDIAAFAEMLESIREEMYKMNSEISGNDFEPIGDN